MKLSVVFAAVLVIVVVALGGLNYYTYSTLNTQLSDNKATLTSQINSARSTESSFQAQVSTQLQNVTASINAIKSKLNSLFPQVPLTTLVVLSDAYDNVTDTFSFNVQNTQGYVVYAQLSAAMFGQPAFGCSNQAGVYVSGIYVFNPNSVTVTQLNLALGAYTPVNNPCSVNPVTSITMSFVIPQSTAVGSTYTFTVAPAYTHS
jgi:hypothetical protein